MLDEINWQTFGAVVMFFAVLFGLAKYIFYIIDKHKEQVDGRFKEHKEKLAEHRTDIDHHRERLTNTREELHRDFVKHDHLNQSIDDIRKINDAIFQRLNSMDKNLNRVIGAYTGKVDEHG